MKKTVCVALAALTLLFCLLPAAAQETEALPTGPIRLRVHSDVAGRTEKDADARTIRFRTAVSMPIATPARQARTANKTQTTATKATMLPQIIYMTGEDSILFTCIETPPMSNSSFGRAGDPPL